MRTKFRTESLKESDCSKGVGVGRRMLLKWILGNGDLGCGLIDNALGEFHKRRQIT